VGDSENRLRVSMGIVCTSRNTTRRRCMSAEENKGLARSEIEEIWTKGNLTPSEEFYAQNYISHQPKPGNTERRTLICASSDLPLS
jgi:hypothetical protein